MTTENAIQSLIRYRDGKIPTGGFLEAVLCNDLKESMGRADESSRENLFEIVQWLYNEMPAHIWGNPERVNQHLAIVEELK